MNYIGSKRKLSPFLFDKIHDACGTLHDKIFCDIFAGTGIVGRTFKANVKKVISNDFEYFSYILNRNYIQNNSIIIYGDLFEELNNLQPRKGFIYKHYCLGGGSGRNYFSNENGQKIDAIRQEIEKYKEKADLYFFLLASLLESADKVANTASVYGAFLKQLKKSAQKNFILEAALFERTQTRHEVYQEDSNELIQNISGDILYLDPPYNARQYGANYHILNTIASYKPFIPKGITGMPEYRKSSYCKTKEVQNSFEDLIKNANFRYIFLSYNNEGLMPPSQVRKIMEKYGHYDLTHTPYQRFKADKNENRKHKADSTVEYLHILEKR